MEVKHFLMSDHGLPQRRSRGSDHSHSPPAKRQHLDHFSDSPAGEFIWKKKVEQQRRRGEDVSSSSQKRRHAELMEELELVKERRRERDRERDAIEEERAREEREKQQAENADWLREEDSFRGKQYLLRQMIRIRDGRPKPIDRLAKKVRMDVMQGGEKVMKEITAMSEEDLEQVLKEVERELDFIPDYPTEEDDEQYNRSFRISWWKTVKTVSLGRLQTIRQGDKGNAGVHRAVRQDLENFLKGVSRVKLEKMEDEIAVNVDPARRRHRAGPLGDEYLDVEFWVTVLQRIRQLISEHKLNEMDEFLTNEKARRRKIQKQSDAAKVENGDLRQRGHHDQGLDMLMKERAKGMGEDESAFADEVEATPKNDATNQASQKYAWNYKYRPRKPRYFNRVHTSYEWTKYNRTHYDHDNPPPKTVRGYRFNVFYPDLIDPSKTPTFHISKTDNPDVSVLTFRAGPPYLDLAFKIINRPWEKSHRKGFRCTFDRGILQLWFNFQRYRYRR